MSVGECRVRLNRAAVELKALSVDLLERIDAVKDLYEGIREVTEGTEDTAIVQAVVLVGRSLGQVEDGAVDAGTAAKLIGEYTARI